MFLQRRPNCGWMSTHSAFHLEMLNQRHLDLLLMETSAKLLNWKRVSKRFKEIYRKVNCIWLSNNLIQGLDWMISGAQRWTWIAPIIYYRYSCVRAVGWAKPLRYLCLSHFSKTLLWNRKKPSKTSFSGWKQQWSASCQTPVVMTRSPTNPPETSSRQ